MKGMNVTEFYGDGAFDTNDLFTLMHQIGAKPDLCRYIVTFL